jgi:phosphate transport system protein
MMTQHIVKAYEEELKSLHGLIHRMGELTLIQIQKATHSLVNRDEKLAKEVIEFDPEIDNLEIRVDELAVRILALRQPVASDLRLVIAALKISNQIERIADYATSIAKRTLMLKEAPPRAIEELSLLVKMPKQMIELSLQAFASEDVALALQVWRMDEEVDAQYEAYFLQLLEKMIKDSKSIPPCTQLLFAAKTIERIGDQSTNIAESVYTMVTGKQFKESEAFQR